MIQWLDKEPWPSVDRAREERLKLKAGVDAGKWFFWALSEGPAGPLLGTLCLWNFTPNKEECEVGFELFPSRQGRGLMKECLETVLDWAWSQLPLETVSALTHRENRSAHRLLDRLGFLPGPIPASWGVSDWEASTQLYYRRTR